MATLERIPYSWKRPDGTWTGPAIELWQKVAKETGFRYELKECTWDEMNSQMGAGLIDIGATGIQITALQDETIDFTVPFDAGGYSLVTHSHGVTLPRAVLERVMTYEVLIWLGFMLIATAIAGSIIRVVERLEHSSQFTERGSFVNSLWWAVSTLSTVGYGDFVPRTALGKFVGTVWIFVSIVLVAIFSATIVATLTVGQLTPYFKSIKDMKANLVGIIDRPSSRFVAAKLGVLPHIFATPEAAFTALDRREIDGFLHPTNELRSLLRIRDDPNLCLLPTEAVRGFVALGISEKLDLATVRQLNTAIIKMIESPEWVDIARAMDSPNSAKDFQ